MCGSKRRQYTKKKKSVCVFHKKSTFVILCIRDLIPPANIPAVSLKEISYFGPGKVPAIISKKMRLGNFYILVRIICFAQKNIKIKNHTYLYAFYKTGSHTFLSSQQTPSTKFQWEDNGKKVCTNVRWCPWVRVCVSARLDGLHIIGREQALTAIFAPSPPPGGVHRFHVLNDVTGFKGDLRFVLCGNHTIKMVKTLRFRRNYWKWRHLKFTLRVIVV